MNYDYTFCMSECENENCFRHKSKIPTGIPVSMAELKGTPECELVRAKHGRWIKVYGDHIHMGLRPWATACSECGLVGQRTNYCPNCGARMKSENDYNNT